MVGILAMVFGLFVIMAALMFTFYKKCSSNELMVKYGAFIKGGFSIKHGGGMLVIPILQGVKRLNLGIHNADIRLQGAYSKNKIPVNIMVDASYKISSNEKEQRIAAEALLDMELGENGIGKIAGDIITGELRAVIANMTVDEINSNREMLKKTVEDNVEAELNKIGLDLTNLNLKNIVDESGVLVEMGKKSASEIKNKAKVDVAEQEQIGRSRSAELEAATIESENDSAIKRQLSERAKETAIGEAEARKVLAVRNANIESEKVSSLKEQSARKEIYESQIETTKKQAELTLEIQRSETVVAKRIENEKELMDKENDLLLMEKENATNLKISREKAQNDLDIAERKAKAITIAAQAEADALILRAGAEAELLAKPKEREAEAIKKLNDALAGQSETITNYLLQQAFIGILPQLVASEAEAISSIGFKDITIIAGGDSKDGGQSTITNTVGDIMKSAPTLAMAMQMMNKLNTTMNPMVETKLIEIAE
jgi:flotillin